MPHTRHTHTPNMPHTRHTRLTCPTHAPHTPHTHPKHAPHAPHTRLTAPPAPSCVHVSQKQARDHPAPPESSSLPPSRLAVPALFTLATHARSQRPPQGTWLLCEGRDCTQPRATVHHVQHAGVHLAFTENVLWAGAGPAGVPWSGEGSQTVTSDRWRVTIPGR